MSICRDASRSSAATAPLGHAEAITFYGRRIRGGRGGHSEIILRRALKKEGVDISKIEFVPGG
jgi:hypothetical protein